jgi:hypothetical protein
MLAALPHAAVFSTIVSDSAHKKARSRPRLSGKVTGMPVTGTECRHMYLYMVTQPSRELFTGLLQDNFISEITIS